MRCWKGEAVWYARPHCAESPGWGDHFPTATFLLLWYMRSFLSDLGGLQMPLASYNFSWSVPQPSCDGTQRLASAWRCPIARYMGWGSWWLCRGSCREVAGFCCSTLLCHLNKLTWLNVTRQLNYLSSSGQDGWQRAVKNPARRFWISFQLS